VKWVGGKTKLLPELRARMPKTFKTYYEPFVGGGALFFAATPARAVLGDMNAALIATYRTVASHVEAVINRLEWHKREHDSNGYYYEVREWWNGRRDDADPVSQAAAFIYLNKTCYNGLWRVNKSGGFNVPRGDYENPPIVDAPNLRAASTVLKQVCLLTSEYGATTADAQEGDFVYFDPPYDPASKTSNFTSYTKDAFGKTHQEQLAAHARELRNRGVKVMLSNNDTEFVRSLYQDFCVDNVKCGRSVNSKADKRGKVDEVIITSYERTS
jgi:DNA adenine methylase